MKAALKNFIYMAEFLGVFRDKSQNSARTNNREFQFPDNSKKFPVLFER